VNEESPDQLLVLWREPAGLLMKVILELGNDVATIGGSKEVLRFAKLSNQR
jgi:hypothetical protein